MTCEGYCKNCGEPLGYFESDKKNIFCYNCNGYSKIDKSLSIRECQSELDRLRQKFREGIINGSVELYLKSYANLGEKIISSKDFKDSPLRLFEIEDPVEWNILNFVLANIGIKWILEDLNYYLTPSKESKNEIFEIPNKWLNTFKRKVYIENNLGIFIKDKMNNQYFYQYQIFDIYNKSLIYFGIFPQEGVSSEKFSEIYNKMLEEQSDPEVIKNIVENKLPLLFTHLVYELYPDYENKIFSFDDILYDNTIPDLIGMIVNKTEEKLGPTLNELFEKGIYFISIPSDKFFNEFPLIPEGYFLIVASKSNPMSIPLLIQYKNEIIITPTRLRLAKVLMRENLRHKKISINISKESEIKFQGIIEEILIKNKVNIIDLITNTKWINIRRKLGPFAFEADIIGIYNEYILIIECRSFYPHPFMFLLNNKEKNKRLDKFIKSENQFKFKIKPWLMSELRKPPKRGYFSVECSQLNILNKKSNKYIMNFPNSFHNISQERIVGLYITQLDECFRGKYETDQIYYKNLEEYLKNL